MTPAALAAVLERLHWTNRTLAAELACDEATIRQMLAGRRRVPAAVATWLDRLAAAHERHLAPRDWRVKNLDGRKKPLDSYPHFADTAPIDRRMR